MYKCEKCGGFVEELGDMVVSDGGCVCTQKKAEESANSLQQLKAEIAAIVDDYSGPLTGEDARDIVSRLRQLSAV